MSCMRHRAGNRRLVQAAILAGIGLVLLGKGNGWGLLLLAIGLVKWWDWYGDPLRRLRDRIGRDAARHHVAVPWDRMARVGLERLYRKYDDTSRRFPQLASEYDELLESLWLELRTSEAPEHWRRVIETAVNQWPVPVDVAAAPFSESLARAKRAAAQWRDAQVEAHRRGTL